MLSSLARSAWFLALALAFCVGCASDGGDASTSSPGSAATDAVLSRSAVEAAFERAGLPIAPALDFKEQSHVLVLYLVDDDPSPGGVTFVGVYDDIDFAERYAVTEASPSEGATIRRVANVVAYIDRTVPAATQARVGDALDALEAESRTD